MTSMGASGVGFELLLYGGDSGRCCPAFKLIVCLFFDNAFSTICFKMCHAKLCFLGYRLQMERF